MEGQDARSQNGSRREKALVLVSLPSLRTAWYDAPREDKDKLALSSAARALDVPTSRPRPRLRLAMNGASILDMATFTGLMGTTMAKLVRRCLRARKQPVTGGSSAAPFAAMRQRQ